MCSTPFPTSTAPRSVLAHVLTILRRTLTICVLDNNLLGPRGLAALCGGRGPPPALLPVAWPALRLTTGSGVPQPLLSGAADPADMAALERSAARSEALDAAERAGAAAHARASTQPGVVALSSAQGSARPGSAGALGSSEPRSVIFIARPVAVGHSAAGHSAVGHSAAGHSAAGHSGAGHSAAGHSTAGHTNLTGHSARPSSAGTGPSGCPTAVLSSSSALPLQPLGGATGRGPAADSWAQPQRLQPPPLAQPTPWAAAPQGVPAMPTSSSSRAHLPPLSGPWAAPAQAPDEGGEPLSGLAACASLTRLSLVNINAGAAGISALADTIPRLAALAALDVSENDAGDAAVRTLARAAPRSLILIRARHGAVTPRGAMDVRGMMPAQGVFLF